jgi:hypothetical protein
MYKVPRSYSFTWIFLIQKDNHIVEYSLMSMVPEKTIMPGLRIIVGLRIIRILLQSEAM